ncbi:MAG TPA: biotin/lipoyl-binding protein [Pirellulales bacterium]|jgi:multidrug efflux pump subunit AcrA (membrane-fusion protein)|nr:biotin/lipoyl-binding protein [Pirellulales bacterium]
MSSASSFDPELIDQTRQQLRTLVHEIEGLSRSEMSPGEFYEGFLTRVVTALAAIGGAIWTLDEGGGLKLAYQMNLQQARLGDNEDDQLRHGRLLHKVAADGQGLLVQPHSGDGENGEAANPTEFLLVLGALKSDQEVQGIVEVFQRAGGRPTVERGYLRFLMQMCDLAGDFLKTRRLRSFADRQIMWSQLEQFTRLVHEGLDPRRTAYTIANEGRRLIGCDRVSVALKRGNRCRVEAISGQELLDNRSNTVTLLGKLASIVVAGGEDLWYSGDTSNLPPQIEESVETYADESHSKMVAVLPLERPRGDKDDENEPPEFLGALVIEQITEDNLTESMRRRIDVVTDHSALALSNAREHNELFLMPVWRAIGKSRWLVQARTLPKTLSIGGAVLVLLVALFVIPMKFQLSGKGTLEPVDKRDVFAEVAGDVDEILVQHGDMVKKDQPLIKLRNNDLDVKLVDTEGKRNAARSQSAAKERLLQEAARSRLSLEEQERLKSEAMQFREQESSYEAQLKLLREELDKLVIRSPINGQVVTWQIREKLLSRPVEMGQLLLTVSNPDKEWELDVLMPEDRMGFVAKAEKDKKEKAAQEKAESGNEVDPRLDASYILATETGTRHYGKVFEIERSAHVQGEEGNVVLLKVTVDKLQHDALELRQGASVNVKVDCGTASIGYCWFHDVISFVQKRILFPLF